MSYQDHEDELDYDGEREETRHYGHRSRSQSQAGDGLDRKEAARFGQDAFKEGATALANAKIGEEKKFLGLFKLDAGIVDMLDGVYNFSADYLSGKLREQSYEIVEKFGPKAGLSAGGVKTAAAAAAIGSTVLMKTGGYFGPIYEGMSSQVKERRELARKLSPVLSDIEGNHSLVALYSAGKKNDVIAAHMHRLGKIAKTTNLTNFINLGLNSGSSLLFDWRGFTHLWADREKMNRGQVRYLLSAKPVEGPSQDVRLGEAIEAQSGKQILKGGALTLLPQAAVRVVATSKHKLKNELQPYSALEMILELQDQVSSNPEVRGFVEPKRFGGQNRGNREYSLEEYLMRICIQHQKEMADMNPQHAEIREALREDLAAAVKPMAAAIRKGDLSVLSLVRLVGEGQIILKRGRALATPESVKELIAREAPKQAHYVHVDPTEYYKDAAFSREQLKEALKSLQGEEKETFAAMFPNAVLADAGMSKKEIKHLREATLKGYDKMVGEAVLGLNAKSDAQLEGKGLAKNEIKQVRDAAEQIGAQGIDAVHDLKTTPVHENGVDRVLSNVVVHQPHYLGTLRQDGRKEMAAANDADGGVKQLKSSHVDRVAARDADAANEDAFKAQANGR